MFFLYEGAIDRCLIYGLAMFGAIFPGAGYGVC